MAASEATKPAREAARRRCGQASCTQHITRVLTGAAARCRRAAPARTAPSRSAPSHARPQKRPGGVKARAWHAPSEGMASRAAVVIHTHSPYRYVVAACRVLQWQQTRHTLTACCNRQFCSIPLCLCRSTQQAAML